MNRTPTYLDYNSTTPLKPAVLALVCATLAEVGNASSVHGYGRAARKRVEDARAQVAALAGVKSTQVVFNSGATEGNNTVIKHFKGQRVLISAIEHPSVRESAPDAERIPVTADGIVDLAALKAMLDNGPAPALVSVMMVNNEVGTIQPVAEIAKMVKDKGALFHCDAVQAAGKMPLNMHQTGADFMTLSAHKMGGPQGTGALIIGPCGIAPHMISGGGQEKRQRAGTENIAGIAGMGRAAELALAEMDQYIAVGALRDHLEAAMKATAPTMFVNGAGAPRSPNTANICLPGVDAQTMLMTLDLEGFAVGSGSACSSGTMKPSPVLLAMGVPEDRARSSLRISLGWDTNAADIDNFLQAWQRLCARLLPLNKEATN
ncbi:MAG: cysteine desulfurase [Alphaproteobacteria bacterium]|nr:cysteine desulfurase [Alphaproteobacteria bacterium]MBU0859962.1 cysteine desulfurase [Alphaproteobacteria bacterium]